MERTGLQRTTVDGLLTSRVITPHEALRRR